MSKITEEGIDIALMKHPDFNQEISLNAKWFQIKTFRALYQALRDDPTGGPSKWYQTALHYHFNHKQEYIDKMYAAKGIIHSFKTLQMYVKELREQYINRIIVMNMSRYQNTGDQNALRVVVEGYHSLQNVNVDSDRDHKKTALDQIEYSTHHAVPTGLSSFHELSHVFNGGFKGGTYNTIAARPAVGKTTFAVNLCALMLKKNPNLHIDYFTGEMVAREICQRFISYMTGYNSYQMSDPYVRLGNSRSLQYIRSAVDRLRKDNLHIYDTTRNLNDVAAVIRSNAANRKPNTYIAIIDYIGLVKSDSFEQMRYRQVAHVTHTFKGLTNDFNIPIIGLAQLGRSAMAHDDNTPRLDDLRESGDIENDSDTVVLLYDDTAKQKKLNMPNNQKIVVADVAKNRYGDNRKIPYLFEKSKLRFTEEPAVLQKNKQAQNASNQAAQNRQQLRSSASNGLDDRQKGTINLGDQK